MFQTKILSLGCYLKGCNPGKVKYYTTRTASCLHFLIRIYLQSQMQQNQQWKLISWFDVAASCSFQTDLAFMGCGGNYWELIDPGGLLCTYGLGWHTYTHINPACFHLLPLPWYKFLSHFSTFHASTVKSAEKTSILLLLNVKKNVSQTHSGMQTCTVWPLKHRNYAE